MSDILLTLIVPVGIAQEVEDVLLAHPEHVRGFIAGAVDGHGASVRLAGAAELVSGHTPRQQIQAVLAPADARAVLERLRADFPQAGVVYWLSPVLELGRLA